MTMLRTFITALAMLAIVGAGTSVTAKKASEPVTVSKPEILAGVQNVMLGGFTVVFVTERKDSSKAGGGLMGGGFGGRSSARSRLEGVTPEQFQAITDAAFADFKDRLAASGITLANRSALIAPGGPITYKPVASPLSDTSINFEDASSKAEIYGPSEYGHVSVLASNALLAGGLGGMGLTMAAGMNESAMASKAKALGTPIINVVYVVDFADAEKYGGWFRSSSSVRVRAGLAVVPGVSRITLFSPAGKSATVSLGQPVAIGGDFGQMRDAMGGGEKAMNAVGNVIGFLGGVGTNSYSKLVLDVDGAAYARGVSEATAQASGLLIGRMVAAR